jgi:hypothetical protein
MAASTRIATTARPRIRSRSSKRKTSHSFVPFLGPGLHPFMPKLTWFMFFPFLSEAALEVSRFMTRFESTGAHGCGQQWYARDMRVYTGSGLRENKNPMSCVHRCIMIHWVETPSTPPIIGQGVGFTGKIQVGYYST